jgi:hypothetical protein
VPVDSQYYQVEQVALRFCLPRILAPRRFPAVGLDLPPLDTRHDLSRALAARPPPRQTFARTAQACWRGARGSGFFNRRQGQNERKIWPRRS